MTSASEETGRARYFALQRLARQQGRDPQELLTLYALEGLLARLAASDHREQLVVNGGMLVAAFAQRRPTRDLDVHAQQLESDVDAIRDLIADVATLELDDGLNFDTSGATAQVIREDDQYSGVRITLTVDLHTAKLSVKVDVNVGDPIWPAPEDVALPRLLTDESLILRGYPLHMVLAEKLVTTIDRGTANPAGGTSPTSTLCPATTRSMAPTWPRRPCGSRTTEASNSPRWPRSSTDSPGWPRRGGLPGGRSRT